jgi:hypothetical protein
MVFTQWYYDSNLDKKVDIWMMLDGVSAPDLIALVAIQEIETVGNLRCCFTSDTGLPGSALTTGIQGLLTGYGRIIIYNADGTGVD